MILFLIDRIRGSGCHISFTSIPREYGMSFQATPLTDSVATCEWRWSSLLVQCTFDISFCNRSHLTGKFGRNTHPVHPTTWHHSYRYEKSSIDLKATHHCLESVPVAAIAPIMLIVIAPTLTRSLESCMNDGWQFLRRPSSTTHVHAGWFV